MRRSPLRRPPDEGTVDDAATSVVDGVPSDADGPAASEAVLRFVDDLAALYAELWSTGELERIRQDDVDGEDDA